MTSSPIPGYGTIVQRGDGANPENFTTIAKVESFNWHFKANALDTSTLEDQWMDYIAGMKDGGQIPLTLMFMPDDAEQGASAGLLADFQNSTRRDFKITFPDIGSHYFAFTAIVVDHQGNVKHDAVTTATVTLQVCGQPTFGP